MTSLAASARHAAWVSLPVLLNAVGGIYTLALNFRVLGAYDYGLLLFIVSVNGFLGVLVSSLSLTARTSSALVAGKDDDGHAFKILRGVQFLYVVFGCSLFAVSLGIGLLGPVVLDVRASSVDAFRIAVPLIGLASVFQFQSAVPQAVLAAHDRFAVGARIALIALVSRLIALTFLTPLLGLVGNALVLVGSAGLEYVLLQRRARSLQPGLGVVGRKPSREDFRSILSGATMMTVVNVSSVVMSTGGLLYVGAVLGPPAVSDLKIGTTLPQNLLTLVFVGYGVVYPRFVRGRSSDSPLRLSLAIRACSFSSAALFAFLAVASPILIAVLTGKMPSASVIAVSIVMCVGYALDSSVHGIVLLILARERQDIVARVAPIELGIFAITTVLLVHTAGVVGAAVASLITFVVMDLAMLALIMRRVWTSAEIKLLLWRGSVLPAALGFGYGFFASLPTYLAFGSMPVAYIVSSAIVVVAISYVTYRFVISRWFELAQRA